MRIVIRSLLVLAALWAVMVGGLAIAMRLPPDKFGAVMAKVPGPVAFMVLPFETLWMNARAGHLQLGDTAPDFTLKTPDGSEQVQLSSFHDKKPVVLIFGSYT
jgi:hypothetical protein